MNLHFIHQQAALWGLCLPQHHKKRPQPTDLPSGTKLFKQNLAEKLV